MKLRTLEEYKEIYKLWIKFLRLSEGYNGYCRLRREESPDAAHKAYGNRFLRIYSFFGDVQPGNFEEWWAKAKVEKAIEKYNEKAFLIDGEIQRYATVLDNRLMENPSARRVRIPVNLIRDQLGELLGEGPRSITLIVHTDYGIKELQKAVGEVIAKHKNPGRPFSQNRIFIPFPHGQFSTSNIEMYFKAYSLYFSRTDLFILYYIGHGNYLRLRAMPDPPRL